MIDHFEKIICLAGENGFSDAFFENAKEHLETAGALLETTTSQTAIFALILDHFGEDSTAVEDIIKVLKCSKMQLLRYMDDFDALRKKRLIKPVSRSWRPARGGTGFPEFIVPMDVIKSIRKNEKYQYKKYENLLAEDFFECAGSLLEAASINDINIDTLTEEINDLLSRNRALSFVKKTEEYDLHEGSLIILLIFCYKFLQKEEDLLELDDLSEDLSNIVGRGESKQAMNRLKSREHKLVKKGLIEFECINSMADTQHFRLSEKAREELFIEIDLKEKFKRKGKNYITGANISAKTLFYSDKINNRIHELTDLLKEEIFSNIQKRLTENGMRTGFACLFSGPPGTGKTETAYQIARETGRDIMLVDISETKSMWFGESEKKIKAVFNRYRGAVKQTGLTPILLFNEADAVLGKRRQLLDEKKGPDQTENSIQNIILQEMENLNGILIATTNMINNFDKAFERRFLYKIEFENPDIEAKKSIWKTQIKHLNDNDAEQLAGKFNFSGGQIENVARKSAVSFILKGCAPDMSILETLCKEEQFEKCERRIGFIKD